MFSGTDFYPNSAEKFKSKEVKIKSIIWLEIGNSMHFNLVKPTDHNY